MLDNPRPYVSVYKNSSVAQITKVIAQMFCSVMLE